MSFGNHNALWLLALVPALVLFLVWAFRARRRALEEFIAPALGVRLTASVNRAARRWKAVLLVAVVLFAALALARPQWGFEWREVKRRGVDVFVVLDVSKSMLAEDVRPNRLTQAKFAVEDLLGKLQGDRVGLIAFAGSVFVQCPLTVDYEAFRMTLRDVSPNSIPRGGTAIGQSLQVALKSFEAGESGDRAIVLITDGEDTEDDPLPAAEAVAKQGVRVYAIGIGTSDGELIPVREQDRPMEFLKDREGQVVKSRLNEEALKQIALKTGGIYVRSAAGDFGIETIYEKGIAQLQRAEHEARLQKRYLERYQWPLGIALALLVIEMFVTERRRILNHRDTEVTERKRSLVVLTLCSLCLCGSISFGANETWPRIYNDGVTAYRSNDFVAAATAFEQATASADRELQARAFYNAGNAYYRQGEAAEPVGPQAALPAFQKSLKGYESALALAPADEDAKFNRDLVKKKIEELEQQQEQQQQQKNQQQQDEKKQEQQSPEQKSQPDQQQSEQKPEQQAEQSQQPQERSGGQSQTNQLDKTQARALLDNLREDERVWNFFPELQQRAGEDKEPEKDW